MAQRVYSDPVAFNRLSGFVATYRADGRTMSAAFLLWFLQTVYRLDEVEAQDAVCDGPRDRGIDALVVEDDQREIVLFQSKWKEQLPGTLGDTDLKKFIGTRANFASPDSIRDMISDTTSAELKTLLEKHDVATKIGLGYKLHTIFIANLAVDVTGTEYIRTSEAAGTPLDVWDLQRLAPLLEQLSATDWFVEEPCRLKLAADKYFIDGSKSDPRMVVGAVSALELVRIPGISDTRVFAQNVRLFLGRTKVNEEVKDSVKNKKEHRDFLTFHNGLTIIARSLSVRGQTLTMNGYSVCNGCQSLATFFDNRQVLTPNLEVIARFVRVDAEDVDADRDLAASIAYRTNNQNPVSLRDQSANDSTQVNLKAEFDKYFGEEATYGIKRSAPVPSSALPNELAGQLLLALYTQRVGFNITRAAALGRVRWLGADAPGLAR